MAFYSDDNISHCLYQDKIFPDEYEYDYELKFTSVEQSALHLFKAVCSILVFCISVPANCFLLWALLKEPAWKTTSDNLLLQLTISDLCLTMTLPFSASLYLHGWILEEWACRVHQRVYFMGLYSYVLILTAMVPNRYAAVVNASCLSAQAPQKIGVIASITICLLLCVLATIHVSVSSRIIDNSLGDLLCVCDPESLTIWLIETYLQIGLFFLMPFIINTLCCVHIWITITLNRTNAHQQGSRLILGMIVIWFLCLLPYNIIYFIYSLVTVDVLEITIWNKAIYYTEQITETLLILHCCLNPLLQIFGAQRFRSHLLVTLLPREENPRSMTVVPQA